MARYLCVSRAVVEVMARSGVPRERLAWVPSGVDLEALASDRERAATARRDPAISLRGWLGAPSDAPGGRHGGGAHAGEGSARVAPRPPRVPRRRAGPALGVDRRGPRRGDAVRRVRRLGLSGRVHLPGFRDDARVLLGQCTIAVVPSRSEGLGTVVLEAQALGVPVVATRSGGVEDTIESGVTGALVARDGIA